MGMIGTLKSRADRERSSNLLFNKYGMRGKRQGVFASFGQKTIQRNSTQDNDLRYELKPALAGRK
jgi:hypothetical protein